MEMEYQECLEEESEISFSQEMESQPGVVEPNAVSTQESEPESVEETLRSFQEGKRGASQMSVKCDSQNVKKPKLDVVYGSEMPGPSRRDDVQIELTNFKTGSGMPIKVFRDSLLLAKIVIQDDEGDSDGDVETEVGNPKEKLMSSGEMKGYLDAFRDEDDDFQTDSEKDRQEADELTAIFLKDEEAGGSFPETN